MKSGSRIWVLAIAALAFLGGLIYLGWGRNNAQAKLEHTRRALREGGFKLELAEFQFKVSPEESARAAALDKAAELSASGLGFDGDAGRLSEVAGLAQDIDWLPAVGTNAALVLWYQTEVQVQGTNQLWGGLRQLNQATLDRACQALLSGPYRFPFPKVKGGRLKCDGDLTPWLACPLAARALLELHDRNQARAWTNLLALTRLVAGWRPQPFAQFYVWRDRDLRVAYGATWQAIQAGGWNDAQLAALQREWQTADVRSGLPEMAAFARAYVEVLFRHDHPSCADFPLKAMLQILSDPEFAWEQLVEWGKHKQQEARYWHYGKYEDEEAWLRLLSDCETAYRRAEACSTWEQITELPGIGSQMLGASNLFTEVLMHRPCGKLRFNTLLGLGLPCRFASEPAISGPPSAPSRLGRVANWEARRRLLVAAIALERYRARRGSYPASLDLLVPELLPSPPLDFMDGQPLRYRRTEDGHFLLYSVGVDCIDGGGNGRATGSGSPLRPGSTLAPYLIFDAPDLIWPRPAVPAEVAEEAAARPLVRPTSEKTTFVP